MSSAPGLEITDNGPGIPLHEREAVFEHFVRGEQTNWSGSGLGLSIVQDIDKLHGASISIFDAADEQGTRVRFEFLRKP